MNAGAAKVIADELLLGLAEAVTTFAPDAVETELRDVGDVSAAQIEQHLQQLEVVLRARLDNGEALALLLAPSDAAALASLLAGAEPSQEELDEAAMKVLQERVEPLLGHAVSALGAVFNIDLALAEADSVANPEDLPGYIGPACSAVRFRFNGPGAFHAEAILLYTQGLEDLCPEALAAPAESAQLSEDEMNAILSGLEVAPPSKGKAAKPALMPPNLDMILDINLVVTARLGRVELPIQEILNLGPGSIIEVGHLVDEPVELLVNNKLIARGDVVVVDEKFGLRITEIVSARERIESLR